ncbi:unnamed protein product, partial [Polarella glacialis]
ALLAWAAASLDAAAPEDRSRSPPGEQPMSLGVIQGEDGLRARLSAERENGPMHVDFLWPGERHVDPKLQEMLEGYGADDKELKRLSWKEAVDLLTTSTAFRALLTKVLKGSPWDAFFWECSPLSWSTAGSRAF